MRRLTLHVPEPVPDKAEGVAGWLLRQIAAHPMVQVLRSGGDRAEIATSGMRYPLKRVRPRIDGRVDIAPGISLAPADGAVLLSFLQLYGRVIDHIGLNISDRDMDAAGWAGLIAVAAQSWPAYRLDIGSRNDIVMLVEDGGHVGISVLELVYDRTVKSSSLHICLSVQAGRAMLEATFPKPFGTYKPRDERFFRSVAPPQLLPLPVYIDLAFTDGDMMPWTDVVHAMGIRIG